jgi:glycosyltransferase involved in cell wall biosynthesis
VLEADESPDGVGIDIALQRGHSFGDGPFFMPMRFHVIGHAHTDTTDEYGACGFTNKTRNFCWMMKSLGHEVHLYGGVRNAAPCDSFTSCVTPEEQVLVRELKHYILPSWDPKHIVWQRFNRRVIEGVKARGQPGDPICVLGGNVFKAIEDALPDFPCVEYGIGYYGYKLKHKIWESHAWKNCMAACKDYCPPGKDDPVIPGFFDEEKFRLGSSSGYLLFAGRVTQNKGVEDACEAAQRAGRRMIVIGPGEKKLAGFGAEYRGVVSLAERNELMAGADALLCPTRRIEAFGNIVPEAGMCGTRVLASKVGAFQETVVEGITGWRCNGVDELVKGISKLSLLAGREEIRKMAVERWSVRNIRHRYDEYFRGLSARV